jgi:hypothetical protein
MIETPGELVVEDIDKRFRYFATGDSHSDFVGVR